MTDTTTPAPLPMTRRCDKCGAPMREGFQDIDGGAFCSLDCAGWTATMYEDQFTGDPLGDLDAAQLWWTEWEEGEEGDAPPSAPAGGDDDPCRECGGDAPHGDRPHKGDRLCWDCYRELYEEGFEEIAEHAAGWRSREDAQ